MSEGLQMKYFVLKPAGTGPYAEASRQAMLSYSAAIFSTNNQLSHELRLWQMKEAAIAEGKLKKCSGE